MNRKNLQRIISVLIALIIWQCISMLVNMEMLLASPLEVIKHLFTVIFEETFIKTVMYSLMRISAGFLLAFLTGCFFAILAGKSKLLETLLWPYIVTMKTVPVASFIILCLIWFSYDQLTVFISFLIAFPVIYSNFLQGIKSTDRNMVEMANLYKVSWPRQLLYIYLPNVKSYIYSACSIAVGMAWKAGIAAEVIGVVNNSIGEKLYDSKIYFQNADLLAWTIVIILLSMAGEKLFRLILKAIFRGIEKQ